jgi:hypothetical protein
VIKEVVSELDVSITNIADRIEVNFVSPKLIKAFHELEQERQYPKVELLISGLRRLVGNGITFAQGEEWKIKRRVTTKMLNFTYIHSLVSKLRLIVESKADELIVGKSK